MSDRMVELQRAKLGLPPASATATDPIQHNAAAAVARPQQLAAATMYTNDKELQQFLQKMASNENAGPTVPTALSRRMLQRQGVSYLDETVASLTSVAADRFLATVLQQAVACRDRRCKGMELAKEEGQKRRKHVSLYRQDTDDRKRRKGIRLSQKSKANFSAVAAAKELAQKQLGGGNNADGSKKVASKKKKKSDADDNNNGNKKSNEFIGDDEQLDDDSLDEEERYYDEYYGDDYCEDENEEEQDDFMLLLRDLERPLEAWRFKLTGKVGLGAIPMEAVEPTAGAVAGMEDDQDEVDDANKYADEETMNGGDAQNGESNGAMARTKSPKPSPSKSGDSPPESSLTASRAATPSALSPVPK